MKLRPFTSWLITWSFLIMTWTGIVLFFAPKGRVAKWVEWRLTGLSKDQYEALHVTFMILFVIGIGVHIYLNWKPLMNYLRNRQRKINLTNRNFWASLLVSAIFVFGTLVLIPPFSSFLDFQDYLKASWEEVEITPPYGHAELSSINELATRMGWDSAKTFEKYKELGYDLSSPEATLGALAELNKTTAQAIFADLSKALSTKSSTSSSSKGEGGGYGRLSIEAAAIQEGFDINKALVYLNSRGVSASKSDSLKPIADSLGVTPKELALTLKELP